MRKLSRCEEGVAHPRRDPMIKKILRVERREEVAYNNREGGVALGHRARRHPNRRGCGEFQPLANEREKFITNKLE